MKMQLFGQYFSKKTGKTPVQYMGRYGTLSSGYGMRGIAALLFMLGAVVIALLSLVWVDIPAPQAPVEVVLDANIFLAKKP